MVVALYEQNQLVAAQQLCEDLMAEVNSSSATEAIATVYITLSRLLHRRQQTVRATRLLEQLASILQLGNYARFVSQLAQESLRQAYISGKVQASTAWPSATGWPNCWPRATGTAPAPTMNAGSATAWPAFIGCSGAAPRCGPAACSRCWTNPCATVS